MPAAPMLVQVQMPSFESHTSPPQFASDVQAAPQVKVTGSQRPPPAQSPLTPQGPQVATSPTSVHGQTALAKSQTSPLHWVSEVQAAPHVPVAESQCPPPAQSGLPLQGPHVATCPIWVQVQTPFFESQTSGMHSASEVHGAPHSEVTGSQWPLVQSPSTPHGWQSAAAPTPASTQVQTRLFVSQTSPLQSPSEAHEAPQVPITGSQWPLVQSPSTLQGWQMAAVPTG